MTDKSLIDTNILVYSYEKPPSEGHKCRVCLDLILNCFKGEKAGVISNQILAEFFYVITRKSATPLPPPEAQRLVFLLEASNHWQKLNYTTKTVINASELSRRYQLSFWDALIAATMLENNIFTIYTENEKDFLKIPGIKVINPATIFPPLPSTLPAF